jgi:hypothetical protein
MANFLIGIGLIGVVIMGAVYVLGGLLDWNVAFPSGPQALDIGAGVVCLVWLLVILKAPWDLFFETRGVLFEMKRSLELGIEVNPERMRYVRRMQRITGVIAVGSHLVSAGIIAGLTFWTQGTVGYLFAFFYILATFFRPTSRAYFFLLGKLREIRSEVKFPREDVLKLRDDLNQLIEDVKALKETDLQALRENIDQIERRLVLAEEDDRRSKAEIEDLHALVQRVERSFQDRIHCLSEEVERSLMKAFDNQDIINGVRAFAKLVKQA